MAQLYDIEIDCSKVEETMQKISEALTPDRFERVMYSEFRRIGGRVKKIAGTDIPQEYQVKRSFVNSAVKGDHTQINGSSVRCTIPIRGPRGTIGGTYKATGGAKGWESLHKKYRIKTKLLKGQTSTLPETMSKQGGMPPFRNTSAASLHGAVFTRKGKSRLPIVHVSGLAVPQMPLNRSRDKMEQDIMKMLQQRMENVYNQVMAGVIK